MGFNPIAAVAEGIGSIFSPDMPEAPQPETFNARAARNAPIRAALGRDALRQMGLRGFAGTQLTAGMGLIEFDQGETLLGGDIDDMDPRRFDTAPDYGGGEPAATAPAISGAQRQFMNQARGNLGRLRVGSRGVSGF